MVSPEALQQLYVKWLCQRKDWKGMKSIIMERKVLEKEDINLASRAVWALEC
ncbi:MAG: hypothetical protein K1W15_02930 [Lachnospiraceae bacterium]